MRGHWVAQLVQALPYKPGSILDVVIEIVDLILSAAK
jgi:hypothetical protein